MKSLVYVTGNPYKFEVARKALAAAGSSDRYILEYPGA
jgi:hypothetical protein